MKKLNLLHQTYEVGILIKFIDGLAEVMGAFLLFFISPSRLNQIMLFLTQHELKEDPKDVIVSYLIGLANKYSISMQYFGVLYLLIHGVVKIIIYVLLVKGKRGGFEISIISLIGFIVYQIYHYNINHSLALLFLTILDVFLLVLVFVEFKGKRFVTTEKVV